VCVLQIISGVAGLETDTASVDIAGTLRIATCQRLERVLVRPVVPDAEQELR
jgi:hypothetical protein